MNNDDKLGQIRWDAQSEDGQVMLSLPWEIFVLGLALLSIFNLGFAFIVRNDEINQIIVFMDTIIITVFLVDLLRRLHVAQDKKKYFVHGFGWVDAISIIPLLRVARVLRIVRVMRVMNRMGGPSVAMRAFFANRAAGGLMMVLFIAVVVLEFGSLAVLAAERGDPDANILTAEDAIWYLIVTMSTVGYGDLAPVTSTGRLVGTLIIIVGVGVFGTLTGFLATVFLAPSNGDGEQHVSVSEATPVEQS